MGGRKPQFRFDQRSSGLLMHVTSLPGPFGSGDLGIEAYEFVDFLRAAGQTWWQMLPVNPPGAPPGHSPYSSNSAFAGSPYLIDLRQLVDDGLLEMSDLRGTFVMNGHVDFPHSIPFRRERLRKAFERFDASTPPSVRREFEQFCAKHRYWLDDWATFSALKEANADRAWFQWEKSIALRQPAALKRARTELATEIRFHQFVQFIFDRQWSRLKTYCNDRGVGLIGDIPIFVGYDSSDVWAHRSLFLLDKSGKPKGVSGYPPDPFNKDGQNWGHPHYDWPKHARQDYQWWVARFSATFRMFDGVRIDHFLGFDRAWQIPAAHKSARRGRWAKADGEGLFKTIVNKLGDAQIIAEDLGQLTPSAARLRDRFKFPGMRVMQFGFGRGGDYHLPHRFPQRCVAYIGTHDNDTAVGWFNELQSKSRKSRESRNELVKVREYVNHNGDGIHWGMIRLGMSSPADTVIFQVQDLLGLDTSHRMNVPGTTDNNWIWRLPPGRLTAPLARKLRAMGALFDRLPRREGTLAPVTS